jgi:hypothetical protein
MQSMILGMLAVLAMLAALARGGNPNVRGAAADESLVQGLNSTNGNYHVDFTFNVNPNLNMTILDPQFTYQDYLTGQAGSGCGNTNEKCSCTVSQDKKHLFMVGTGTDGTATGLVFGCDFVLKVSSTNFVDLYEQCSYQVRIPYSGDNSDRFICLGHTFLPNALVQADGHAFSTQTYIDMF